MRTIDGAARRTGTLQPHRARRDRAGFRFGRIKTTRRMRTKPAVGLAALPLPFTTTSIPAIDGAHTPDVEARLVAAVGDRTIAGQEATYRKICEWYGDCVFVVCRSTGADGSSSAGVLGYSKRDGTFTCYRYGHRADSRRDIGFPSGQNGIAWTSESRTAAGALRMTMGSSDRFRASAGHGWPARESSTQVLDLSEPSPDMRRT